MEGDTDAGLIHSLPDVRALRPGADSEDRCLVAAAKRDRAAFAGLYRKYAVGVYRYFYQQIGHPQDAEDLTAATFGKALASLDRYQEQGSFAAWLFSIARHTLLEHRRRRHPLIDIEDAAPLLTDDTALPEAQVLQQEQLGDLTRRIRRLPPDQREALTLRFFGELPTRDVATVMGRTEGAVKMLVYRAIAALRDHYQEDIR